MHELISVSVLPLKSLFSDAYHFRLPYFQRAYAWQTGEVGRLLSDITAAMQSDKGKKGYFLGKLTVAKKKGLVDTALVDGHQRVMSLTILFAVLRDLESDAALQVALNGFVRGAEVRLSPQEVLAEFCERYVQAPGSTALEPELDLADLCETERNVIENRNYLRTELSSSAYTPQLRRALSTYLAERCSVIVCAIEDEDEAWSFLRTEEETRVDFSASDRAKFSLLSIIPADDRGECQKIWEACEALLGATDMHALLGHLRTLKRRRQSGKPVEIDIAESYKFNVPGAGRSFLEKQAKPASERFAALRRGGDGGSDGEPPAVQALSERMKWIDAQLWVPAALLWLERDRGAEETQIFFKRLERLVWMMRIAGFDPTKQHSRIIQLLGEIDRIGSVSKMTELDTPASLRDMALANLRSTTFDSKQYAGRVLRRICIALGQDPGPVEKSKLTIEHILPRGFDAKTGWRTHFPSRRSVQLYSHRLGNLTFLTPEENQLAATLDWADKRPILARSQFSLSARVAQVADWSPEQIVGRTEELIGILFKDWEIKV